MKKPILKFILYAASLVFYLTLSTQHVFAGGGGGTDYPMGISEKVDFNKIDPAFKYFYITKTMLNTEGYAYFDDSFNIKFEQIDNDVKYWGQEYGNSNVGSNIVAPRIDLPLPNLKLDSSTSVGSVQNNITFNPLLDDINQNIWLTRVAWMNNDRINFGLPPIDSNSKLLYNCSLFLYFLNSTFDYDGGNFENIKSGIYTYKVYEDTPSDAWISSNEKYILKIKFDPIKRDKPLETKFSQFLNDLVKDNYLDEDVYETEEWTDESTWRILGAYPAAEFAEKYDINFTVSILKEKQDGTLESYKAEYMNFTNTLVPDKIKQKVTLSHKISGDTSLVPNDRIYKARVTITKPDGTILSDYNRKVISFTPNGTAVIEDVPVGSKVKIEELNADNPGLLGNHGTTISRYSGYAVPKLTDPQGVAQSDGGAIADSFLVVKANAWYSKAYNYSPTEVNDQTNTFVITDTYQNIVNTGLEFMISPFVALITVTLCSVSIYTIARHRVRNR